MQRVGVCGHFGGNTNPLNGQTVKTKMITAELKKQLGDGEVKVVDTYGGAKKTLSHLHGLWKLEAGCKNIIIMPAHNGLRILAPFLSALNRFYRRRIHYIVIGGWLPTFVSKRKFLKKCLKEFHYIYVETSAMKEMLEKQGFHNIVVMPNCKDLPILQEDQLRTDFSEPFPLCTFSRVTEEKGIEDAIQAVKQANEQLGRTAFSLDIYGQVDQAYGECFEELERTFPEYIRYKGCVPFGQSVDVLKNYVTLLFPTYYEGEGFAGTILDAFAAGVPVLASDWNYNSEIIKNHVTGILFEPHNTSELCNKIIQLYDGLETLLMMRKECLKEAYRYMSQTVIQKGIIQYLN